MNTWIEGIQNAIAYIEENLTEEITVKKIAEKAYVSEFHGVMPSAAKQKGAKLRDFAPLKIKISLEGGTMMEYKIVEKEAFTIMGRKRKFNMEDSYEKIPEFWNEHYAEGAGEIVMDKYGLCIDSEGTEFDYYIADDYDSDKEIPQGYETRTLPAGKWAVFPCTLGTLQDTNTKMWKEWLPNCREYKLGGNYNIELYTPVCKENPKESYCELWLPLA